MPDLMSPFGPSRYFAAPQQLGRFQDKADIQPDLWTGLFTVVPNISRQLPVTSDLLPDHNVLPRDFFWRRIFSLQAEVSYFIRGSWPE